MALSTTQPSQPNDDYTDDDAILKPLIPKVNPVNPEFAKSAKAASFDFAQSGAYGNYISFRLAYFTFQSRYLLVLKTSIQTFKTLSGGRVSSKADKTLPLAGLWIDDECPELGLHPFLAYLYHGLFLTAAFYNRQHGRYEQQVRPVLVRLWWFWFYACFYIFKGWLWLTGLGCKRHTHGLKIGPQYENLTHPRYIKMFVENQLVEVRLCKLADKLCSRPQACRDLAYTAPQKKVIAFRFCVPKSDLRRWRREIGAAIRRADIEQKQLEFVHKKVGFSETVLNREMMMANVGMRQNLLDVVNKYGAFMAWKQYGGTHGVHPLTGQYAIMKQQMLRMAQRADNIFPTDPVIDEETNMVKSFTPSPWLDGLHVDRIDRDVMAFLLGQAVNPTHMPEAQPNRMRKAALEIIAAGFKGQIPCITANFVLAGGFMAFSDPLFLQHCCMDLVQQVVDNMHFEFKELSLEQEQFLKGEDDEMGDARMCFNDLMKYSNDSGKGVHHQAVTLALALVTEYSQGRRPMDAQAGQVPAILVRLMSKLAMKPLIHFVRCDGLEHCLALEQRLQSFAWFGTEQIGALGATVMHAEAKKYNFVLARMISKKALKQESVALVEKSVEKLLLKYAEIVKAEAEAEAKGGKTQEQEEEEDADKAAQAGAAKDSKRPAAAPKASGPLVVHARTNMRPALPVPVPVPGALLASRTQDPSGGSYEAMPVPPVHSTGHGAGSYYHSRTVPAAGAYGYPRPPGYAAPAQGHGMPGAALYANPAFSKIQAATAPVGVAPVAVGLARQGKDNKGEALRDAMLIAVNDGQPLDEEEDIPEPTPEEWAKAWEEDPEAAEHLAADLEERRRLKREKPRKVVKLRGNCVQWWVDWYELVAEYVHMAAVFCAGPSRLALAVLSAILPSLAAFELVRDHFQLNGLLIDLFSTATVDGASSTLGRLTWLFNLEFFRFSTPAELFRMRESLLSPWFIAVYFCVGLPFIYAVGWFARYAMYYSYRVTRGLTTWEKLAKKHPGRLWKVRIGFVIVSSLYLPVCKTCVSVFTCLPYRDSIAYGPAYNVRSCVSLDEPSCWCNVIISKGQDAVHYYHGLLVVCALVLWFIGFLFPHLLAKSILKGAHGLTVPTLLQGSPPYTPRDFAHDLEHFPPLKNHPMRHLFIGLDQRWLLYKVLLLGLKMLLLVGVVAGQGRHNVGQTAFALAVICLFVLYRRGGLARVYIESRNNAADLITLYTLLLTSLVGLLGSARDLRLYSPPMPAGTYTHLQNTVTMVQVVAAIMMAVFLVWSYRCARRRYKRVWRTTLGFAPSIGPGQRMELTEALLSSAKIRANRKKTWAETLLGKLGLTSTQKAGGASPASLVAMHGTTFNQIHNPMVMQHTPLVHSPVKVTVEDGTGTPLSASAICSTKEELDRRVWRGFWDQLFSSLSDRYPSLSARYSFLRRTADLMPPGAMLGPPVSDPEVISSYWSAGRTDVSNWSEEQVRAVLVYILQGPDVFYSEALFAGEEATRAGQEAAGQRTRTGFGFMVVKQAPFHVVFTDDDLGRQFVLYDMGKLRQLVTQNVEPRVQRMVRVRKALRALDGQKVFWPMVRKRKIVEHHRRQVGKASLVTELIDNPTPSTALRTLPQLRDHKVLYQYGTLHVYPPTRRLLPNCGIVAQTCADALGIPKADVEYMSCHGFSVILRYEDGTLVDSPETQGDALSLAAAEIGQPLAWMCPGGNPAAAQKAKEEFDKAECDPPGEDFRCFVADHRALGITYDFKEPLGLSHLLDPDQHSKQVREGFRMARVNVGMSALNKVRKRLANNVVLAEQRLQGLHKHGSLMALELRKRLDRIREEEVLDHILHPGAFHSIFDKRVPTSAVLMHLQRCQINPVLRNLYSTHKHALDLLFARVAYVNSHPGYKLWYVFWHNIWAENAEWLPQSRIARAALDPELPTALIYHPMPRQQLEEKLEDAGLCPLLKGRTNRLWFSDRVLDALYERLAREEGNQRPGPTGEPDHRLPIPFQQAAHAPVYDARSPEMREPTLKERVKEKFLAGWTHANFWPPGKPFEAPASAHPVTQLLGPRSAALETDPAKAAQARSQLPVPSSLAHHPLAAAAAAAGTLTPGLARLFGVDYNTVQAEKVVQAAKQKTIGNAMVSTYSAFKTGTMAPRRTTLSLFGPIPKDPDAGKEAEADYILPNGEIDKAAQARFMVKKALADMKGAGKPKKAKVPTGTSDGQSLSLSTLQAKAIQKARSVADKEMVRVLADLPVHGWLDELGRQLGRGELLSLTYCDINKKNARKKKLDREAKAAQEAADRQQKPAIVHEPTPAERQGPYSNVKPVEAAAIGLDDSSSMPRPRPPPPRYGGDRGGAGSGNVGGDVNTLAAGAAAVKGNMQGNIVTGTNSGNTSTSTSNTNSGNTSTVINISFGAAAPPVQPSALAAIPGLDAGALQMITSLLAAQQAGQQSALAAAVNPQVAALASLIASQQQQQLLQRQATAPQALLPHTAAAGMQPYYPQHEAAAGVGPGVHPTYASQVVMGANGGSDPQAAIVGAGKATFDVGQAGLDGSASSVHMSAIVGLSTPSQLQDPARSVAPLQHQQFVSAVAKRPLPSPPSAPISADVSANFDDLSLSNDSLAGLQEINRKRM